MGIARRYSDAAIYGFWIASSTRKDGIRSNFVIQSK